MPNSKDQMTIGITIRRDDPLVVTLKDIAREKGLRTTTTTVARIFLEERVKLYDAGWGIEDSLIQSYLMVTLDILKHRAPRDPHLAGHLPFGEREGRKKRH